MLFNCYYAVLYLFWIIFYWLVSTNSFHRALRYFKFNVMYAVFQTTICSIWLEKGMNPIASAQPQLRIYTDHSYMLSSTICQLSCLAKCNAQNLYFLQLFCPNTLPPLSICSLHFGYEKLWVCFQTWKMMYKMYI